MGDRAPTPVRARRSGGHPVGKVGETDQRATELHPEVFAMSVSPRLTSQRATQAEASRGSSSPRPSTAEFRRRRDAWRVANIGEHSASRIEGDGGLGKGIWQVIVLFPILSSRNWGFHLIKGVWMKFF